MRLYFELSRDKTLLERNVYTVLDLLSDIGGIQGLLVSFFALIVSTLNTDRFEEHLIA